MPDEIYNSSFTGTQIDAAVRKVTENAAAWDAKPTTEDVNNAIAAIPIPSVPTKTSQLTNDSGYITGYTETDPTVPAWAKAESKPTYTASEVGAAPTNHAVNANTYGLGSGGLYGHVKLSASIASSSGVNNGYAATPSAVKAAYDLANGKASTATYTVSIPASWSTNSAGGYMQTVTVSGMLATDNPIADVILGTDVDANALYLEAWSLVTRITTAANSITLYANGDAPATAFTIQLKAVR